MTIQHRDIPDSELHQMKGASSASQGSVPVANGVGGTTFQKLGVANFSGSLPTNVPDLVLATDGAGGFKQLTGAYGRFQRTASGGTPVYTTTQLITPSGMYLDGDAVRVASSGYYWYSGENYTWFPGQSEPPIPASLNHPQLQNVTSLTLVFSGLTGIVYLDASTRYNITGTGTFSFWKMAV